MNYFTSEEVYLGTSNSTVESINVEFHENGRAVISPHSPSSDGFVEVRADEYGYYYDYAFNNIYNAGSPNSQNSIYTVSRPQHDEYGNWVGDRADIVFTDRYGDQHVVAAHSDLAAGQRFGNLQESNASSLGNGHYLIAYSVRDDSGTTGSDIYYRVFDTSTSSFTSGKKLLGSTENFTVEAINVELHEEGRVVLSVEPPSANGFTAEIRQDSDYYYLDHTFREISSSPGNADTGAYTVSRHAFDENGAAISHDQADIIFTDLHGVSHVVADYSEMAAGSNVRFGNTDMNSVGSMGNGNYLIAFTVRNDSGPDQGTDLYYRIFDTETGSFTGTPEKFGSTQTSIDRIRVEAHDYGRVLLSPDPPGSNAFTAEISDSGEPLHLVELHASYESGVVYSRGDAHSDAGTDYGIMFYDPYVPLGGITPEWQGMIISQSLGAFGSLNLMSVSSAQQTTGYCCKALMATMPFQVGREMTDLRVVLAMTRLSI